MRLETSFEEESSFQGDSRLPPEIRLLFDSPVAGFAGARGVAGAGTGIGLKAGDMHLFHMLLVHLHRMLLLVHLHFLSFSEDYYRLVVLHSFLWTWLKLVGWPSRSEFVIMEG